jgi:hypothetical protein
MPMSGVVQPSGHQKPPPGQQRGQAGHNKRDSWAQIQVTVARIAQKTKSKVTNVGFLINEAKSNLKKHLLSQAKI